MTTVEKALTEWGGCLIPGCYDALSAKVMTRAAAYKVAFVSGCAVSASLLGEPDVGLLTPPEMARKASQICAATPQLALIADADTGGGNALNVQRTVRQLIAAGCKGCVLEDQEWPKKPGHMRNKEVVSMEEFASKVAAARAAIGDADFFLIARTDARGTSAKYGLAEAITRANLYVDAGADASLIEGPRSTYELQQICEHTKGYRAISISEGGLTPAHTYQQLKELGFQLVFHPMSGLYAAAHAMEGIYRNLAEDGTTAPHMADMMKFEDFRRMIGYDEKIALEERYSKAEGAKLTVRVRGGMRAHDTPAAYDGSPDS